MKQIKTFFVKFITYIFAVLFAGSLAANAEIKVVTTIKPLHSLISNVMDGVGEPSLIIEGSTSPHSFVLKPSHAKMIEQADIIFWIGEDIETFMEKPLESIAKNAKKISFMELTSIEKLKFREENIFDHDDHDDHGHGEKKDHDDHGHGEDKDHDDHGHGEKKDHDDHGHGEHPFEWAGLFDLKSGTYKWSFSKVDGKYADPAMRMVILPAHDIEEVEETAEELLEAEAAEMKSDGEILVANNVSYSLNFDESKDMTHFTVNINEDGKYAFFTEHMPFEFESDEHFFKDVSNNDVEPIAQVPDEGDGHHHHHHGHGSLDPHVWHDPANIIKMSEVISKNLKKDISIFNRKDRKSINERIDSTESILSGLNGWIVDQVSTIPEQDRVLVSKHKAMDYYGAAFGFETVSLLDFLGDSSSLRPENISSTLNMLKEENVKAIFPEQIPASKLLKNLSRQSSVPLASNQIFVDGLMMKGNTISVAVHNTCTIVDSLGGSCDKESGSNLESEWYKLSD